MSKRLEFCCGCGEEYPREDLLAGWIYCPKCRADHVAKGACPGCGCDPCRGGCRPETRTFTPAPVGFGPAGRVTTARNQELWDTYFLRAMEEMLSAAVKTTGVLASVGLADLAARVADEMLSQRRRRVGEIGDRPRTPAAEPATCQSVNKDGVKCVFSAGHPGIHGYLQD